MDNPIFKEFHSALCQSILDSNGQLSTLTCDAMLFSGNLGRFDPGRAGHNIMVRPFFAFAQPGAGATPLPLFNEMHAHVYFKIWSGANSMAATVLPGGLYRF